MGLPRLLSAFVMLGAAIWIGVLVHDANTADLASAAEGTFPIQVIGPDGPIYNDTVFATDATAYRVLQAAAEAGGFEVQASGSGATLFVESIAGYRNQGAAGWCYAVWDGQWTHPARSAAVQTLQDGQATRWTYESGGCPR